ncbi:MAG: serine/threonine protein kinase [Planctomycetota bacterium]|nr:serine/threonine protein kinase [Planctomycetota bacterium]
MDSATPKRIGLYALVERIGRGGETQVYRGIQEPDGTQIAVKFVPRGDPRYPELRQRLLGEATLGLQTRHPNLVRILASGELEEGCYVVQEFLDGRPLHHRLRETPGAGLPPAEAARIGSEVAGALGCLHARDLVHADLKPPNVMLCPSRAVLCDLGSVVGEGATRPGGIVLGTPSYIAPELLRGAPISRSADLWSLGVVLFEMLTGTRPFGLNTDAPPAILEAVRRAPLPPLLLDLPLELRELVEALLERDPSRRPRDAGAIARRLSGLSGP